MSGYFFKLLTSIFFIKSIDFLKEIRYNKMNYIFNYYILLNKYNKGCAMKKVLYVVSTYYHALISCVKQLLGCDEAEILCTDYIPDGESLSDRIRESGLFDKTYSAGKVDEYQAANIFDYIFSLHRKNAETIERQFFLDLSGYNEINIFHDNTWFAHYLKDKKIKYRLIEDALDSFKKISKSNFAFMVCCNPVKLAIKRLLDIGYVFCGYDECTAEVEVNDLNLLEINRLARGKLVEVPRKALFDKLTDNHITVLTKIFMKDIPPINAENSVLLLTQPLYIDRMLDSEEMQIELFKEIVKKEVEDESLIIKPHPRDMTDYSNDFPNAVILDKNMPVEIIELSKISNFLKVISYNSTSLKFIKACEYVNAADKHRG